MLKHISRALTLSLLLLMTVSMSMKTELNSIVSAAAQSAEVPFSYAAVTNSNELWVYPTGKAPIQIETPDAKIINNMDWSPNGGLLAYVVFDENYSSQLIVTDPANGRNQVIATGVNTGFPISFQDDDHILYALSSPDNDPANGINKVDLWLAPIFSREATRVLGTFDVGVGCGGGSIIPADWVYDEETGGLGGFHLILAATPFGIVHSTECGGSSVALLNPETGEDIPISSNFTRPALSPDGTKLAGIELNVSMDGDSVNRTTRLLVADLATLAITELTTSGEPQQIAFSADNTSLFYTTRVENSDFYITLSSEDKDKLNTALGFDFGTLPRYTSEIWQVNIAANTAAKVYTGDHYAIGRIIALSDGSALIFSTIPNLDAWVSGLIDGSIKFDGDPDAQRTTAKPIVYSLNLSDQTTNTNVVGEDLGQITISQ
ncbi:MAG TPA: hypothetical protein VHL11_03565 [Phototrophicaceae bacterium]|jgi:dipeptidyl aminopeptidase/acylaminoacyl peptidase|nr:hypothetical protein [Phototrophicaceae bacterium]